MDCHVTNVSRNDALLLFDAANCKNILLIKSTNNYFLY